MSEPRKFGCHCELDPDTIPDWCVLDYGKPEDCIYSRCGKVKVREECEWWKPIDADDGTSELAALRAENARLREALGWYANRSNYNEYGVPVIPHEGHPGCKVPDCGRTARAALGVKP